MSAVPEPNRSGEKAAGNSILTNALAEQAQLRASLEPFQQRIQAAIDGGAQELVLPWTTHDGRDADMLVYYVSARPLTIVASQLQRIDGSLPNLRERLTYERQFASELDAAGDTWEQVASYVWEQQ